MIPLYPTFLIRVSPHGVNGLSTAAGIGPNSILARRRRPVDKHDQVLE